MLSYHITEATEQDNKLSKSEETRRRVADLLHENLSNAEITEITGASKYTIWRVKKRVEAGIGLKKKTTGPPTNKILTETFLHDLRVMVEDNTTNQTQVEMAKILKVSRQTVGNGLKILGLSPKKSSTMMTLKKTRRSSRKIKMG